MKSRSFNTQLLLVILAVIALCWIIVLAVVLTHLSFNRTSTWDEKLGAIATQLLTTIPADIRFDARSIVGPGLKLRPSAEDDQEQLAFQIWVNRDRIVSDVSEKIVGPARLMPEEMEKYRATPGAPDTPLQPDFTDGAASTMVDGEKWRVYSVTDSTGHITIQVGNLQRVVDADLRREAAHALLLATLLLFVGGVIMWFVVRKSLKPVKALGTGMRQRRNFDFTPLPLDGLPRELYPLVESFNHVLEKLDHAIEGERRFIGDAAHELRTPLSALQAQAEIALHANSAAEKDIALKKLLVVAKRSTRLSEQLLDLARLNASAKPSLQINTDLSRLVLHVAQEFEVYASYNRKNLSLDIQPCTICCDIDEIGILLRNLVDNAMRYTGEYGKVLIRCGYQIPSESGKAPDVYLEVSDDGPGVPLAERDFIFVRFHRIAGNLMPGSGIGLSLVADIAESHRAVIETDIGLEGKGLTVRVVFPSVSS